MIFTLLRSAAFQARHSPDQSPQAVAVGRRSFMGWLDVCGACNLTCAAVSEAGWMKDPDIPVANLRLASASHLKAQIPTATTWEFPKIRGPDIDPQIAGLLLQGLPQKEPPIYRHSHDREEDPKPGHKVEGRSSRAGPKWSRTKSLSSWPGGILAFQILGVLTKRALLFLAGFWVSGF